jgi:SAM-dependent methyltransferase
MEDLYAHRRLSLGYPNLSRLAYETFTATLDGSHGPQDTAILDRQIAYLDRVVDLSRGQVLVLGCGPCPQEVKHLIDRGLDAIGVEPVPSFVESARRYVGRADRILIGSAERIPLADATQQLVYCNSVLEHVDSPTRSLEEMHRVLRPGGIAFIVTTNRHYFSLAGRNAEFNVRFFNWLPEVVKESYTFRHLHYEPRLANYTGRPAVHWYTYSELCKLGRNAGFTQFYSPLDLLVRDEPRFKKSPIRRLLLASLKSSPWLRSLALTLTYYGGMVIMLKGRPFEDGAA